MLVKKKPVVIAVPRKKIWLKVTAIVGIFTVVTTVGIAGATRLAIYEVAQKPLGMLPPLANDVQRRVEPFPIGVDPETKTIIEHDGVDTFLVERTDTQSLARRSTKTGWFGHALAVLSQSRFIQTLASPSGRILVIQSGERKEEVANNFADILNWDKKTKEEFLAEVTDTDPQISEGKFLPSTYVTARNATSSEVADLINERFDTDVLLRYTPEIESKVPLANALTIASLLEREAYDFNDMRYISGIIWNRLFTDMNLQLDATLQYAKGTKSTSSWWPRVVPADKYIASDYNTYKYEGLPPAPIANPSLDAILAALNPRKTDCMYYFHDKKGGFHCSVTYEEHVASLKEYYGRGK